jgi:hypothetical protein
MKSRVIGNGASMYKTMENFGFDPYSIRGFDKGGISGGVVCVSVIDFSAGANADLHSSVGAPNGFQCPIRVFDVLFVASAAGGTGDTAKVSSWDGTVAGDITNAVDMNISDKVTVRAGTLDDAKWDVAKHSTLRVTVASGAKGFAIVYWTPRAVPVTP